MHKLFIAISLFAVIVLGLAAVVFGQSLSEGSVVALQILPNPENRATVYDFELCCGFPGGSGGNLPNGFSYDAGTLALEYRQPGDSTTYTLTGTISLLSPQAISKYCTVMNGNLINVSLSGPHGVNLTNLVADYIQLSCQRAGVFWLGPGGLTVHAP